MGLIFLISSSLVLLTWVCKNNGSQARRLDGQPNNSNGDIDPELRSLTGLDKLEYSAITQPMGSMSNCVTLVDHNNNLVSSMKPNQKLATNGKLASSCNFMIVEQSSQMNGSAKHQLAPQCRRNSSTATFLFVDHAEIELSDIHSSSLGNLALARPTTLCTNFDDSNHMKQDHEWRAGTTLPRQLKYVQDTGSAISPQCYCMASIRQQPDLNHNHRADRYECSTLAPSAAIAYQHSQPTLICTGAPIELNSQGELTVTDESSSFIHDDSFVIATHAGNECHQLIQAPGYNAVNLLLQPSSLDTHLMAQNQRGARAGQILTNLAQSPNSNSSQSSNHTTQQTWSSNGRRVVQFMADQSEQEEE